MRVIVPPTGNETISHAEDAARSLSTIGVFELLRVSPEHLQLATYKTIPLLLVASIWYIVMTSVLTGRPVLSRAPLRVAARRRTVARTPLQKLGSQLAAVIGRRRRR